VREAIREVEGGVLLNLVVSAGGKELKLPAGYDEWRKSIKVILSEEPRGGKANRQLVESLSSLLNVPSERISIIRGERDSRKVVKIEGISAEEVEKRLRDASQ